MSVKHAISRGLELGRSVLHFGLLKTGGRVAAKLRADRFRAGPSVRTVQPQAFLPSRYRYYRTSLRGLAAQLQSSNFMRRFTGGAPRNRAVCLAFGLGVGLIEQQFEEDRLSAATCQEIKVQPNPNPKHCRPYRFGEVMCYPHYFIYLLLERKIRFSATFCL